MKRFYFWLRTTYAYYYYLCFKDLFKKLLKPKKMITIKWKIDPNGDFKFYTEITNDLLYNTSPIFYQGEFNHENKTYKFEIVDVNCIRGDCSTFINPKEFFRIITNGQEIDYIFTKDKKHNKILVDCEILKWFENNQEIPFDKNKILEKNNKCILDYTANLLVIIEDNFEVTNNISELKKVDYNEFIKMFGIK